MNLTQRQLAEQCLDKICQFYANKNAVLSVPTVDGRLNSAANEEEVINDIDSFYREKKRELFDEYISPLIGLQTARMGDVAL